MKTISFLPLALVAVALLAIPVPARAQTGLKLKTVVIDPGHGGKDAGCVSRDKKTYEKNVALDIALRLQKKINAAYPDVNVKMTRSDDRFIELENRAVMANKANANLFISIHVNAVEKGTQANGYSIHVLGQSQRKGNDLYSKNLDLVKRENSVILLEDNYQTRYQGFDPNDPQSSIIFSLMQNAHLNASLSFAEDVANAMGGSPIRHSRGVSQDPFWVLWRTAMPAVLIEVGFMTNPEDLAVMRTAEGRDEIAGNIFRAFCVFKHRYDGSMIPKNDPIIAEQPVVAPVEKVADKPAAQPAPAVEKPVEDAVKADVVYGIQVMATGRRMDPRDPFFHGYEPMELQVGNLYKYIICTDPSLEKVKAQVKKVKSVFKDIYLVKVEDGTTSAAR
jgi:N-acetylmuramoyl-L-alanine amidase